MTYSECGFSLFELLIVMMIAMIVFMITVPNEKHFLQTSQEEIVAQQLLQAIYSARSEAMMRGTVVTLCRSTDLKNCSGENWLQGYIMKSGDKLISTYQNVTATGKIHWRSFPKNRDVLTFLPSGFSEVENGTFWYCAANNKPRWAIIMNRSGRARLALPDHSGKISDGSGKILAC
jgi:type IV fimbrial biogenesis protein FimT